MKAFAVFDVLPHAYGWSVWQTFKIGDTHQRERWVEQWSWWP